MSVLWANQMVRWVRPLAAKPGGLSSVPGTHVMSGKNQFPQVVYRPSHAYAHSHIHTQ